MAAREDYDKVKELAGSISDVFCYRALAAHLGAEQPFFGLQPPGLDGHQEPLARVEDLAVYFADQIRAFRPNGPSIIVGFCAGGSIAFELARLLLREGAALSLLALFGAPYPTAYRRLAQLRKRLAAYVDRLANCARRLASLSPRDRRHFIGEKLRNRWRLPASEGPAALDPVRAQRANVERATFSALRRYVPGYFGGHLSLFLPCEDWARSRDEPLRWRSVAPYAKAYFGPERCTTDIMLGEPYATAFAELFNQSTQEVENSTILRPKLSLPRSSPLERPKIKALSF